MNQPDHTSHRVHDIRTLCHHAFPSTSSAPHRRCGSPALRGESFCYYHHPTRKVVSNPNERRARRTARQSFTVPLPTNRQQLQLSLVHIMQRITTNQIDLRRAGLLLFALQAAGHNLTE
jgi:hypothetical protein